MPEKVYEIKSKGTIKREADDTVSKFEDIAQPEKKNNSYVQFAVFEIL